MTAVTNSAIAVFLLFIFLSMRPSQASTLSDEGTVYASLGGDVVLPWNLTLDQGSTIRTHVWQKDPSTPVARLLFSGTTFVPDAAYLGRVSAVPGSIASINLTNITEADVGTYRCSVTVNDGGTSVQLVDTQGLQIKELVERVTISSNAPNTEVEQGERVLLTCDSTGGNPPPSSYIWLKDGTSLSTTTSNTLVIGSFQQRDVGTYSCIASNLAGNVTSSNIIQLTLAAYTDCRILLYVLIIFECQSLWAAILIIAILVADACRTWTCTCSETCSETCIGTCTGTCTETCICKCKCTCPCDAVKILACFGPLVGVVLAVIVITLASVQLINLPGTCSYSQAGYVVIIAVSAVALSVSICAAIAGWWFKKHGNKLDFPIVTVVLEFLLGFVVAIAGIVVSVLYVQEQETSTAGIALGVICLVLLLAAFIWFMYRVCGPQKPTITIEPSPSSDREVEVKWTGESVGTYRVLYRTKGSHDWTSGPEVSTDDPPNYNYTVQFPQNGTYEVCVQWTITCCLFCCHCWPWSCCLCCLCWGWKMTSEIKEVTVPVEDNAPYGGPGDDHGRSGEQNTPFSPLHGNNTSKTDVPLVFMISEGQSHQVKLEPIAINKQNPTEKREKKKKKRKKVNKVTASDEETKPED